MLEIIEEEKIENLIYEIRGKQVMIDSDLARIYKCKNGTKEVNQAVKNNLEKFPERFSWILTNEELNYLRSKFLTTNISNKSRVNPRVFTEQGVMMLATILKSKIATETSIRIMDAFVKMRHFINNNIEMLRELDEIKNLTNDINEIKVLTIKNTNDIEKNSKTINKLQNSFEKYKDKINYIFYNGQVYDAYSKIIEIFNKAKKELIIIDGYANKEVLDMIKTLKNNVTLITKNNGLLTNLDIKKYNEQYNNLNIIHTNLFHDRYFIIDYNDIYHCGTSINHAGNKTFSINLLEDEIVKKGLIDYIKEIV